MDKRPNVTQFFFSYPVFVCDGHVLILEEQHKTVNTLRPMTTYNARFAII